jgi:hypothetical protein
MPNFAQLFGLDEQQLLNDPNLPPFLTYALTGKHVTPGAQEAPEGIEGWFGKEQPNEPLGLLRHIPRVMDVWGSQSRQIQGMNALNFKKAADYGRSLGMSEDVLKMLGDYMGMSSGAMFGPVGMEAARASNPMAEAANLPAEVVAQGPYAAAEYLKSKSANPTLYEFGSSGAYDPTIAASVLAAPLGAAARLPSATRATKAGAIAAKVGDVASNPFEAIGLGKSLLARTPRGIADTLKRDLGDIKNLTMADAKRMAQDRGIEWDNLSGSQQIDWWKTVNAAYREADPVRSPQAGVSEAGNTIPQPASQTPVSDAPGASQPPPQAFPQMNQSFDDFMRESYPLVADAPTNRFESLLENTYGAKRVDEADGSVWLGPSGKVYGTNVGTSADTHEQAARKMMDSWLNPTSKDVRATKMLQQEGMVRVTVQPDTLGVDILTPVTSDQMRSIRELVKLHPDKRFDVDFLANGALQDTNLVELTKALRKHSLLPETYALGADELAKQPWEMAQRDFTAQGHLPYKIAPYDPDQPYKGGSGAAILGDTIYINDAIVEDRFTRWGKPLRDVVLEHEKSHGFWNDAVPDKAKRGLIKELEDIPQSFDLDVGEGIAERIAETLAQERLVPERLSDAERAWVAKVRVMAHRNVVEQALAEGKPVPREVLEDYPDLLEKYPMATDAQKASLPKSGEAQFPWADADAFKADVGETLQAYNPSVTERLSGIVQASPDGGRIGEFTPDNQLMSLFPLATTTDTKGGRLYQLPKISDVALEGLSPELKELANKGVVNADDARRFFKEVVIPHELQHAIDKGIFGDAYKTLDPEYMANKAVTGIAQGPEPHDIRVAANDVTTIWNSITEKYADVANRAVRNFNDVIDSFELAAEPAIRRIENALEEAAIRSGAAPGSKISLGRAFQEIGGGKVVPSFYVRMSSANSWRLSETLRQLGRTDAFRQMESSVFHKIDEAEAFTLLEQAESTSDYAFAPIHYTRIDLGANVPPVVQEKLQTVLSKHGTWSLLKEPDAEGIVHKIIEVRKPLQKGRSSVDYAEESIAILDDLSQMAYPSGVSYFDELETGFSHGYATEDVIRSLSEAEAGKPAELNQLAREASEYGRDWETRRADYIGDDGTVRAATPDRLLGEQGATTGEVASDAATGTSRGSDANATPTSPSEAVEQAPKEAQPVIPLAKEQKELLDFHWSRKNNGARLEEHVTKILADVKKLEAGEVQPDQMIRKWGVDISNPEAALSLAFAKGVDSYASRVLGVKRDTGVVLAAKWLGNILRDIWLSTPMFIPRNMIDMVSKSAIEGIKPFPSWNPKQWIPTLQKYADAWETPIPDAVKTGYKIEGANTNMSAVGNINPVVRALLGVAVGSSAGPVGAAVGAAGALGFPKYSNLIKQLNQVVEEAGRGSAWIAGKQKFVSDNMQRFVRQHGLPEEVAQLILNNEGMVGPERVRKALVASGMSAMDAVKVAGDWRQLLYDGDKAGVDLAHHIHFDYADRRKVDDILQIFIPFVTWPTRNILYYSDHIKQYPFILEAPVKTFQTSERERQQEGLTKRFDRNLPLGDPGGLASAIYGSPSEMWVNPSNLFSFAAQFRSPNRADEDAPATAGALEAAKAVGLGLWPYLDLPAQVLGAYGTKEFQDLLPMSNLFRSTGKMNDVPFEPEPWKAALQKGQEIATGEKAVSLSGSPYRDYLIQKKLAEMSVRATGDANDPLYVQAMSNPNSQLYQLAEKEVDRSDFGAAVTRLVSPLALKQLPEEEKAIRQESKARSKESTMTLDAEGKIVRTQAGNEAFKAASEKYPLASAYQAVGDSPEAVKLQGEMDAYYSLGSEYDRTVYDRIAQTTAGMDSYTRTIFLQNLSPEPRAAYNRVLQTRRAFRDSHPMLAQYLSWSGSVKEAETPQDVSPDTPLPDTSIARFLTEHQLPSKGGQAVEVATGRIPTPLTPETAQVSELKAQLQAELQRMGPYPRLTLTTLQKPGNDLAKAYLAWKARNPSRSEDEFIKLWAKYKAEPVLA